MNFYELLILAKSGDNLANEKILAMYQPLLTKESVIDGVWDEDLYAQRSDRDWTRSCRSSVTPLRTQWHTGTKPARCQKQLPSRKH